MYIPYWFKVTLSSDAAVNDLDLYKQLLQYNDIDPEVSLVVLKAQSRHYWYLAPDSIILWSMFGDELTDDEKGRMAAVLLTKPQPESYAPKKVSFPVLTPTTTLASLITSLSWFPFYLLNLSSKWLELPPSQWEQDEDYKAMRRFSRSVKLTNDVAERGVKLISDYADCLTKDSEERKRLILVAQNHRRNYPQFRKVDLLGSNNNQRMAGSAKVVDSLENNNAKEEDTQDSDLGEWSDPEWDNDDSDY